MGVLPPFLGVNAGGRNIQRPIRPMENQTLFGEEVLGWRTHSQKWLRSAPSRDEPGLGRVNGSSRSGSCTSLRHAPILFPVVSEATGSMSSNGACRPRRPSPEAENLGRPPETANVFRRTSSRWFSYNIRGTVVCTPKGLKGTLESRHFSDSNR